MANLDKTAKGLRDMWKAGSQRGVIGRQTDTGVILRESPMNSLEVYVTLNDDPRNAIVAICKFNQVIGSHVWVQKGRGNRYEVVDIDYTASFEVFGNATPDLLVPQQTGALDQSLRYTANMIDGRGRAATGTGEPGGLNVFISSFNHAGGRWAGDTPGDFVDLSGDLPATADTKAWVLVCINEGTNLPVIYTGTEVGLAATQLVSALYDITIADDDLPVWAWELTDDQTTITASTRNVEFRWWLTRGGGGGSFSGDAYDVPYTPADANDWLTPTIDNVGDALDERAERHFKLDDSVELTIASDAITIPATGNHFRIDTESDVSSDSIVTINGGEENKLYFFRAENTARTVQFTGTGGNIKLLGSTAYQLTDTEQMLFAVKIGTDFFVLNMSQWKWTFAGDSGGAQTIDNLDHIDFQGGAGITTQSFSNPLLTITLNINELTERVIGSGDMLAFHDVASGLPSKVDFDDLAALMGGFNPDVAITFNDADYRIESDGDANNFFSDGGNNNIGIGTGTPDASAKLQVVSTSKGTIPAPVMTAAQMAAISSPAEGLMAYASDSDMLHQYDAQRFRNVMPIGWLPYAYPMGVHASVISSSSHTLAANGGSLACPIVLTGHMLLESVTINQRSTGTARTWGWDIYAQYLNNGNSGENTLARVAASNGDQSFTPSAADNRTLAAASAPVYLGPGIYWLVIQSRHATSTRVLLGDAGANLFAAVNHVQTKTTTNPNGATLDFVAATWTKSVNTAPMRLNGRVFGATALF
jgi:hypothetical protein